MLFPQISQRIANLLLPLRRNKPHFSHYILYYQMKHSILGKIALMTLIAVIFAGSGMSTSAQMHKGEKAFGPMLGYASENKSAIAGLTFQYAFSDNFRLSPEIGYIFRNHNIDAFAIDLNAEVPFDFSTEKVALYPFGGLAFRSWSHRDKKLSGLNGVIMEDDVTTRRSRFGFDLGVGFEMRCNATMKFAFEAEYVLIRHFSYTQLTASLSYIF